jgi:hypothetical protein
MPKVGSDRFSTSGIVGMGRIFENGSAIGAPRRSPVLNPLRQVMVRFTMGATM